MAAGTRINVPESLRIAHEELHEELARATRRPDEVGEAARAVAKLMHAHFISEEEYAMVPLGLLAQVVRGEMPPGAREVQARLATLRTELPRMLDEHRQIVEALERLGEAARKAHEPTYERFAEKVILHARTEEEVLYPAALLLGDYLALVLRRAA